MRKRVAADDEPLVGQLTGGVGLTYELASPMLVAGFLEGSLQAGRPYQNGIWVGVGPSLDVTIDLARHWRASLGIATEKLLSGAGHSEFDLLFKQRVSLGKHTALRLEVARKKEFANYWTSGSLTLQVFF